MLDWLRDPMWQFIGAIVAIGSLVYYLGSRKKKHLSYRLQVSQLLSVEDDVRSKLKITFAGKAVHDLQLVTIRFFNSGNQPILSNDFEAPIEIGFAHDTRIFKAEVARTVPESLNPSLSIKDNSVIIQPLLMNSKDWINISILLTQFDEHVRIRSRIAGINQITLSEPALKYLPLMKYGFYSFIGVFPSQVAISLLRDYLPSYLSATASSILWICFLLGAAVMVFGGVRYAQLSTERLDA